MAVPWDPPQELQRVTPTLQTLRETKQRIIRNRMQSKLYVDPKQSSKQSYELHMGASYGFVAGATMASSHLVCWC